MAHQFVLLFLILTHTFLTMSTTSLKIVKSSNVVQPPAFSPLNNMHIIHKAEAPTSSRRMGKHHHHVIKSSESPAYGPSSDHDEENAASGSSGMGEESGMYLEKHQHHNHESGSVNKSMAGGGVILGGLVMAFVVSIVCYIRATRRKSLVEPPTPTTARSSASP